jgi:hypothetical protein
MTDPVEQSIWTQMVNPADSINLYEGEQCVSPVVIRGANDMRKWLRFLSWDLLRFAGVTLFKGPFNPAGLWGIRDQVNRIHLLSEMNAIMLMRICESATPPINISDVLGYIGPPPAATLQAGMPPDPLDSTDLHRRFGAGLKVTM